MRLTKSLLRYSVKALRLLLTNRVSCRKQDKNLIIKGEWLNGRVVVSKTIGCVFESRLPCQNKTEFCSVLFFLQGNGRVFDQQAQVPCAVASDAKGTLCKYHAYYFAIPSLRSLRIASYNDIMNIDFNVFDWQAQVPCALRLTQKSLYANISLVTSLFRQSLTASPYESRLYGY